MVKYKAIEIVRYEDGTVEHTITMNPPKSERTAERTVDGVNRNLDHERFYTRMVEVCW
jgi:hypothetical protein